MPGPANLISPPATSESELEANEQFRHQVMDVARFRSALSRFDADTARIVRQCRLTPQRYLLLLMIEGAPDGRARSTVSAIAERLSMPHNTVSELVARAVEAGLVRRTPEPSDRRSASLSLTDEGDARLRCAVAHLADQRTSLRGALRRTGR
jgi:DNA-binding MarR family transcriptional regulator